MLGDLFLFFFLHISKKCEKCRKVKTVTFHTRSIRENGMDDFRSAAQNLICPKNSTLRVCIIPFMEQEKPKLMKSK